MPTRILSSIDEVAAERWNALDSGGSPFLRHEFLAVLEQQRCVGAAKGWQPHHLLLENRHGDLEGAMPLYLKSHSWGEFVFDFSWAEAYAQAGLDYYPKLLSMPPFTPATGTRLLVAPGLDPGPVRQRLTHALIELARANRWSSAHALFVSTADREPLGEAGFLWRKDCQFHWHNRGYRDFEHFMSTFRADKRKKALRERRRIREGGVNFLTLSGAQLDDELWDVVFGFAAGTFELHGHEHYLSAGFFKALARTLPDALMVKVAVLERQPIAAAIFFRSPATLYGRYWGAAANFHSLHFETCYYQGIEYCIEHGLRHFEPGTQGEHKVARGFEPTETWSAHWIAEPRFRRAIESYLAQERVAVDQYILSVVEHVPFRRESLPCDTGAM